MHPLLYYIFCIKNVVIFKIYLYFSANNMLHSVHLKVFFVFRAQYATTERNKSWLSVLLTRTRISQRNAMLPVPRVFIANKVQEVSVILRLIMGFKIVAFEKIFFEA